MRGLLWIRGNDLRLADQPAVTAAAHFNELLAVCIVPNEPDRPNHHRFLMESCAALATEFERLGSRLILLAGDPSELIPRLVDQHRLDKVVGVRGVDPDQRALDARLAAKLDCEFELFDSATLCLPGTLRTGAGTPYLVFTPFARAFRERVSVPLPLPAPDRLPPPIEATNQFAARLERPAQAEFAGGEPEAHRRLARFLGVGSDYPEQRDRMDLEGTSRLSADLKFGTISPRRVWHAVAETLGESDATSVFQNELLWREFNFSTMWDRPELLSEPFRPAWAGFPWREDEHSWEAWKEGFTGYPVVDAASRQLLAEGFVHNRARMISASFLTKHLLIDYARGERHYLEHLTDGDLAQNNAGWQWSAGCGCDAQPWFRIFNPVIQGRKFDPDGAYVRHFVPELATIPARWIHEPWMAPHEVLADAGVELGRSYPDPIVNHAEARERFLRQAKLHLG